MTRDGLPAIPSAPALPRPRVAKGASEKTPVDTSLQSGRTGTDEATDENREVLARWHQVGTNGEASTPFNSLRDHS